MNKFSQLVLLFSLFSSYNIFYIEILDHQRYIRLTLSGVSTTIIGQIDKDQNAGLNNSTKFWVNSRFSTHKLGIEVQTFYRAKGKDRGRGFIARNQHWGFHTSSNVYHSGTWTPCLSMFHINTLEFMAMFIALSSGKFLQGLIFLSKLTSPQFYITSIGAVRPNLKFWTFGQENLVSITKRQWLLTVLHIIEIINIWADSFSRSKAFST